MSNSEYEAAIQRGLLKPTLQITVFSILGIAVTFVTQIIIAAKFGATIERDAYFAAVVVPAYITTVLVYSLTVTFIPIFIEYETKKSKEEAWKVASVFLNLIFLVLFGISLLGFLFARQLIWVTAPGFKREELLLTASLLRIIFPSTIFSGLSNLLSSIYYAHHRFLRPAVVPVINAVLVLSSVIVFTPHWGIKSLAFGSLAGAIVGFSILVPILFKHGRYRFSFDFHNEGVRQIIRVMSPLVFAGLFYRATTVIERMIASTLPTGSISYLGYANKITSNLQTIATIGISTTIFPVMARSWAENDLVKVREYFARGVRIIMLITFPIAMVFVVLRVPIIQVVFERGAFDHSTTIAVANVLAVLLVGFIASGIGNVAGKGFYISQKTKLQAILGIAETSAYLCFAYFLGKYFSYKGLAWATSIYLTLGLAITMFVMKRIYNGINGRKILKGFGKILICVLLSGILIFYCFRLLTVMHTLVIRVTIAGSLGIVVYMWLVVYVFKLNEAIILKQKLLKEIRRRLAVEKV